MKILLISDVHHFSTKDVFDGYVAAFKQLGVDFEFVDMPQLCSFYNTEIAWGLALMKLLNQESGFTHGLFISGVVTPDWVLKSNYTKKIGIIGLDDPHAGEITLGKLPLLNYYFTNEKKMEDEKHNVFYIPTATSTLLPQVSKEELPDRFKQNISFIGTVYEHRIKQLEEVCRYCEEHNLTFKVVGPLLKTPKDSILRKYATDGVLNNNETKLVYRGSDIVLNLDRNIHWNPLEDDGNSTLKDVGEPYSMNPRAYEIAGCRTIQLFVNPRKEALDVFGDNIYSCREENIKETLDKIYQTDKDVLLNKINTCFNTVIQNHTYVHRAVKLLKHIQDVDSKNS